VALRAAGFASKAVHTMDLLAQNAQVLVISMMSYVELTSTGNYWIAGQKAVSYDPNGGDFQTVIVKRFKQVELDDKNSGYFVLRHDIQLYGLYC